jgi:hypothetical protein
MTAETTNAIARIAAEVRERAVEEYGPDLKQACLLVAPDVSAALKKAGFACEIIAGYVALDRPLPDGSHEHMHYWNEADGLLVDIAGSQFNALLPRPLPDVVVGRYADFPCYRRGGVFGSGRRG